MVISEPGLRNLEQLREDEGGRHLPGGVTAAFLVLSGSCVVFVALALGGRASHPQGTRSDPLGDLVARRGGASPREGARAADLRPSDVTFPQMLSDRGQPTTALAAVRPAIGPSAAPTAVAAVPEPPPATDRLTVVPLPAQAVLEATPVVTRPRDSLTKVASDAAQLTSASSSEAAPSGHDGGYQLQVSSFHTAVEADSFAQQLRARGHKAYAIEARVPGRGTWYRVRIGPFATQRAAAQYRTSFEAREHVVPFLVIPESADKGR